MISAISSLLITPEEAFIALTINPEPKMSMTIQRQITRSNEDALTAFVQKKAEIDAMLARLQALSDEHFDYPPHDVTWGHVGTLEHYAELLKRITDSAFKEGEHAA